MHRQQDWRGKWIIRRPFWCEVAKMNKNLTKLQRKQFFLEEKKHSNSTRQAIQIFNFYYSRHFVVVCVPFCQFSACAKCIQTLMNNNNNKHICDERQLKATHSGRMENELREFNAFMFVNIYRNYKIIIVFIVFYTLFSFSQQRAQPFRFLVA